MALSTVLRGFRHVLGNAKSQSASPKLPPIYNDETAATTLHLFRLLESVHFSGIPFIWLSSLVHQLAASRALPLETVTMHPALTGTASGSVGEMAALATITAAKNPNQVLEFGTHEGCSTWHLWANSPPTARITTLDLPSHIKVKGSTDISAQGVLHRPFLPKDERVTLVEIDSRDWQPCSDDPVDLCFIDGGHSYECVRNDTEKAMQLMASDGVIVWHDASWTDDGYAVNAYLKELRHDGQNIQLVRVGPYDYCALAVLLLGGT